MSQVSDIIVYWTAETSGRAASLQIQSRIAGTNEWTEQAARCDPAAGEFRFTANAPSTDVEVRLRYISVDGIPGDWFSSSIVTAPAVVEYTTVKGTPTSLGQISPVEGTKLNGIETGATRNRLRGEWVAGTSYAVGDIVSYQNASYGVLVGHTSSTPPPNTNFTTFASAGTTGPRGEAGVQGPIGPTGATLYTWIAYSNSPDGSENFTTGKSAGRSYIGIANNKTSATEGSNPSDYTWSLIKGTDGVPGAKGVDGLTTYTWFAYASSADGSQNFTTGNPSTVHTHIGISPNRTTAVESTSYGDYQWALIKGADGQRGEDGAQGQPGANGQTLYTWIAYASSADGTVNFTTGGNAGQNFIGIANNKTSATESNNPSDYTWSQIRGTDGVPGSPGVNGQTTYTWFSYSSTADGYGDFTTANPDSRHRYVGISANRLTPDESGNPGDYTWALIKGADGANGAPGAPGANGSNGANGANGVDALLLTIAVPQLLLKADINGSTKSGQLPRTIKATSKSGISDVSGSTGWSVAPSNGSIDVYIAADGNVTITRADAEGYVVVYANYNGVALTPARIELTRQRDTLPPGTAQLQTASFDRYVNQSTYVAANYSPVVTIYTTGQLRGRASCEFTTDVPDSGRSYSYNLAARVYYRVAGSGSGWSDLGTEQAGSPSTYRPLEGTEVGLVGVDRTVSVSAGNYEIMAAFRRVAGNSTGAITSNGAVVGGQ